MTNTISSHLTQLQRKGFSFNSAKVFLMTWEIHLNNEISDIRQILSMV